MLKLLLAGFKGVGKTTTGRLLADRLDLPFFDTDEMLSLQHQKPVRQLHEELAEERFREEEAKMLEELKHKDKSVIALGGGTLLSNKAQELAPKLGSLVYLYSSPEVLMEKLQPASFIDAKDPYGSFKAIFEKRHPLFCKLCTYRIDVDGMTAREVAYTILDFYG
jgi:shikimate kinase